MKKALAVALFASFTAACGGSPSMTPSAPTAAMSLTGTWVGSASDSSSALGAGSMMGQAGMGAMTWQLAQNGSKVSGSMTFSGMQGRTSGAISGTVSGDEMTITMDMPMNSMMPSGCSARATGIMHINRTTMTMTGSYSGTNSCSGAFADGQMTMTRQ